MRNFFKGILLGALAVSLFHVSPLLAAGPQWYDATHIFEQDVLNLTKSVKLETKSDWAKRFKAPPPQRKEYKVGDVEKFWTKNIQTNAFEQIQATVKAVGKNCYVFLENGKSVPDSAIQKVVTSFDSKIYPTDTSIFGTEWKPGVDGDNRITLLMFDIKDGFNGSGGYVGGYFFAGDEFLQSQIPAQYNVKSNEREMFYLDINPADPTNDKYMSIVAHEFQHMIHFFHDPKEFTWLNESCSQIGPYFCGYGHAGQITSFMQSPDNSMTAWAKEQVVANYGQVYLWNYYILNRYLKTDALKNTFFSALVDDKSQGSDAFDKALKRFNTDFSGTFSDFAITNFVNDPKVDKGQYAYDSTLARLHLPLTAQIKAFPGKVTDKVFLWSADGIKVDLSAAKNNVTVAFKGSLAKIGPKTNNFQVAVVLSDSRDKLTPKIGFIKLAISGNLIGGNLSVVKDQYDSMTVVVVSQGPRGLPDNAYAQAPAIPYQLDFTDSGAVVASRGTRTVSPQRLISDYLVSAEAVSSTDEKVSTLAFSNLEGITADMGKTMVNQLDQGSAEAVDHLINAAIDTDSRESLRPLAKKMAEQLESWKAQKRAPATEIEEKIQLLRSF